MRNDDEYTGQTGDPLHDAIYGWDLGSESSHGNDNEYVNYTPRRRGKSDYDVIEKAREYSIQGNHLKAIEYCERARGGFKSKILMVFIAREYEAMGDYNYALGYWNDICDEFFNSYDVFEGKADLLYHLGRYDEAITSYKKALTLLENSGKKSQLEFSRLNNSISNTYNALGKSNSAEKYKKTSKQFTDDFVTEKMEIADRYYNEGNYYTARTFYKMVLKHDFDNVKAKNRVSECERILSLSVEEQNKLREEAKERLKREEKERKKREKREKRERERIAHQKRMKEFEEQQRRRKEACEKNPDCIKKEIQHFKKKVLKDYYLLLHFEHYQNKSDIKFKEILEYEELLEKLGVTENYSRDDLKILKKENRRIKYIISHVEDKYRGNGVKLFVNNQKKIDKLEKRYPEKGLFNSIINEVFNDSEDIESLEVESSVRDKIQKAENLFSQSSSNKNVNLQEAKDLINHAHVELSNYLKNKNESQYSHLINLRKDISRLESEINNRIINLIKLHKKRLFLINRNKYQNNNFVGKPGMNLKLVREDNEEVFTVYSEDEPIGIISSNHDSDFEKQFFDNSQLKYLPKNSYAKYYFKYERFDIIEIEETTLNKEKAKLKFKQQKLINKYPKEELITITISGHKDSEFKQGTKFKLIKEQDNKSTKGSIGVYLKDEKIGFIANNPIFNLTSKAKDIKNIPDDCYAKYLCKYEYNYHVAWIINKLKPVNDYISKKEYNKAIIYIDHLLITEPENVDYWLTKCSCYEKLNQYEDVNDCYDKLIELDSENSDYLHNKALNLVAMKRYDDALECLDEAILYNPSLHLFREEILKLKEKEELKIHQEEILNDYPKHELITINKIDYSHRDFEEKMIFKLIKESHDSIAVYLDDDNVGHVAKSGSTACDLTSDASDIKYVPDICYARYIMNYCGEYHIAQLITDARYIKVKLALEYINKKEYSKALDCYNDVLELYPNDEFCLYRKAEVLSLLKRWHRAHECYDILNSWGGKAYVYIQMEKYEEALYCFDKLLESDPYHMRTLREKGRLLIDLKRYKEAIKCLDKALSQYPNEQSVLSLKKYALHCLNEERQKEREFKRLLHKSYKLINQKRYEDALKCLNKALQFNQETDQLLYLKGKALAKLNRYEESIECLDRVFELNHECTSALNIKGIALCHLKQFDKAKACLEESILLNSNDSCPFAIMGGLFSNGLKDYDEAIKYYKKAISINPKCSYAFKSLGNLFLIYLKDYNRAINYLQKAIYFNSKDDVSWCNLAYAFLNIKEYEEGLQCCERAMFFNPKNYLAYFTESRIYYELEQYDQAMYAANQAMELNSTDPDLIAFIDKIQKAISQNVEIDYGAIENELENEVWYKDPLNYGTDVFKDTFPQIIKPEDIDENLEAFEKWIYHKRIVSVTKSDNDITEEVKMRFILIMSENGLPDLTKDDLDSLSYNERNKYYHCKRNIPLLEKWLRDNSNAPLEEIDKKHMRLKSLYQQLDNLKINVLGLDIDTQEGIHFYFSSKQFFKVMLELGEEIKESSYNDVLGKILSYKNIE